MINQMHIDTIADAAQFPSSKQLAFIGPSAGGGKIRAEFSLLQSSALIHHLADTGDIDRKALKNINALLSEFQETVNCTVICTPSHTINHFGDDFWSSYFKPVMVTNRPVDARDPSYIGIQRHLFPKDFDCVNHNHLRLGEIRKNVEQTEVMLRGADCVLIDLNVLRLSDNLGSQTSSTAGLMIEELCMIAKYAGASAQLKTIVINGYDQNRDEHGMMAKNIALLLFYILDGFDIRQRESEQTTQLQKYTVMPDKCEEELVFVEDQRSGRWWVQLFSDGAEEEVQLACTREDYEDACNNVISDRLTSLLTLV